MTTSPEVDPQLYPELAARVRAGVSVVLVTVVDGPGIGGKLLLTPGRPPIGSLGHGELDRVAGRDAVAELVRGVTRVRRYGRRGEAKLAEVAVFVESFVPPARMIVLGAVDFAAALTQVAKILGFRVTLGDARPVFATAERFPFADEVVVDWPHRLLAEVGPRLTARDAICVLTHEAKFDVPAIVAALETGAGYIGVMGSRRTHASRVARLREAGVDDAGLARLHSPIGLDLGAQTPEETAVSICAEVIAVRSGTIGVRPLSRTTGPIHRPVTPLVTESP